MSSDTKKHWLGNAMMGQFAASFKFSAFYSKFSKVPTEKYAFPTTTNILDFFLICIVKFNFYIYFRDSIYNIKSNPRLHNQ